MDDGRWLLAVMLVVLGLVVASVVWTVRLWRRRKQVPGAARVVLYVAAGALVFGGLGTLLGLIKAFGSVGGESVDPSQKARILAEGISEAMNCTAFGLLVWMVSALLVAVLTRKVPGPTDSA